MAEVLGGERSEPRRKDETPVVDVDVHEMLTSIEELVPHLDEPWRSRIAINDGFKGPPGHPYSFPRPTGEATQDAVTDDGTASRKGHLPTSTDARDLRGTAPTSKGHRPRIYPGGTL